MFLPLKGLLQGEIVIRSGSVGQQHESAAVQFKLLCSVYCVKFQKLNAVHATHCGVAFSVNEVVI
jgi:hypothetical protein